MTHPIELLDLSDSVTESGLVRMLRDDDETELTFDGTPLWAYVAATIVDAQEKFERDEAPSDPGDPTPSVEACVYDRGGRAIYIVIGLTAQVAGESVDDGKVLAGTAIRRVQDSGRIDVHPTNLETTVKLLEYMDVFDLKKIWDSIE